MDEKRNRRKAQDRKEVYKGVNCLDIQEQL